MNLNQITAHLGEHAPLEGELAAIIKELREEEDRDQFVVFLIFDLQKQQIYFSRPEPFSSQSLYEYNYLGNNPGASMQYYLTRDLNSLRYLLGTVFSDLFLVLKRQGLEKSDLYKIVQQMKAADLINLQSKRGKGTINLKKLRFYLTGGYTKVEHEKKALHFCRDDGESERYNYEQLLRQDLDDNNKRNQYTLIVPAVKTEGNRFIILSNHPNFIDLVKKEKLGTATPNTKKKSPKKVCHLCRQALDDVSYEYAYEFNQSRINKIFTATTINTAPGFYKKNYDLVYALCKNCYLKLLTGEKVMREKFHGRIANEGAYIIPESLLEDFDYNNLARIKKDVDLAFKAASAREWLIELGSEAGLMKEPFYTLNFIIYRTDGKSVDILQSIEDVPTLRFMSLNQSIADNIDRLGHHLKNMSISSIYNLIPIRVNKKKKQIDISRVLTLYKALFSGGTVEKAILFSYATEALDKGMRQLAKNEPDNYFNMQLAWYRGGNEDFFIKRIIMGYLVLFRICQEYGLLNNNEFTNYNLGSDHMEASFSEKIDASINRVESFLQNQGFKDEARALFYLGSIIYRVAIAQLVKEHRTKPILKKIDFQGMNQRDVNRLYLEAVEKLRQYDRVTLFAEALMNRFHHYAGIMGEKWPLNEHANVFYIMAGYAYMVGSKPDDINPEEKKVIQDDYQDDYEEEAENSAS
ncbi:MAG: CRISPR-associated protein [Firmicutes bacterium]|nr:CRISPR-associated protein [Bacillota bacterium]